MNIEIVNKQISTKLNLSERDVEQINKFYWQRIKQHIYNYNPAPLNISNICVLYPMGKLNKKLIQYVIKKIRYTRISKRFSPTSNRRLIYIDNYNKILRKLLAMRKYNKFTN